jgi:hypothetical protein
MRNSEKEIKDANIRAALRDAASKGKLCVVAAVVGLSEKKLNQIMDGEFDIPPFESSLLGTHLSQ